MPPGMLPLNSTCASSGNSVMSLATLAPLKVAVSRTFVVAVTALVPTANDALVWPAGTVTLAGMVAGTVPAPPFENAFESATMAPPAGAAAVNVTVAVAHRPPPGVTRVVLQARRRGPEPHGG